MRKPFPLQVGCAYPTGDQLGRENDKCVCWGKTEDMGLGQRGGTVAGH